MPTINSTDPQDQKAQEAVTKANQDLNDQGYVFVQIDGGRWLIERTQRQAREAFAPIRPPRITGSTSQPKDSRSLPDSAPSATSESLRPAAVSATANSAVRAKPEERP